MGIHISFKGNCARFSRESPSASLAPNHTQVNALDKKLRSSLHNETTAEVLLTLVDVQLVAQKWKPLFLGSSPVIDTLLESVIELIGSVCLVSFWTLFKESIKARALLDSLNNQKETRDYSPSVSQGTTSKAVVQPDSTTCLKDHQKRRVFLIDDTAGKTTQKLLEERLLMRKKGKQEHTSSGCSNDHLRRFHGMMLPKEIWAAIRQESLEKGYDRFQKLLSQLDALGATKASSSKHKPSHNSGSYSSYTTSSSKATPTATPGLADEIAMNCIKISSVYKKGQVEAKSGWKKCNVAFDREKVDVSIAQIMGILPGSKFKGSTKKRQINWVEQTTLRNLNHALMAFTDDNELIDCGMSLKLLARESDEGYYDIPTFTAGFKTGRNTRCPPSLSGDYTPRAQEDIDDSFDGELESVSDASSSLLNLSIQ
ncbi:hypothetical protein Tco_0874162 [Tanacetum coccineum]|uniref:Uncharacterized protein n=1 Tax=Tanacetum coccineum TaxID=301880 RepID=A0ABQ5BKW0_9ASTR